MKLTLMMALLLGNLLYTGTSFAERKLNKLVEKKKPNQSTGKKRRRKKVQMCHECGKPEPQCECEGHREEHKHGEKKK